MRTILLLALLCLLPGDPQAAGVKTIQVPASVDGPALKAMIWTPCATPAQEVHFGPNVLMGTRDCPTLGDKLPLVVISHGHGGSYLGHHDLAEALADAGFVAAAVNHPGDTFSDMSRASDPTELAERPSDIKRLIDYLLTAAPDAAKIDPGRVGFFGFSRGGFTGLVLAGAIPDFLNAKLPCPVSNPTVCAEMKRSLTALHQDSWTHDPRIKAYGIADPLNAFPTPDSLKDVRAPIQLWGSQFGGDGVAPESVAALADALPVRPDLHVVSGAAHFAFLSPCSAELTTVAASICVDASGFDRAAFHKELNAKTVDFLRVNLP